MRMRDKVGERHRGTYLILHFEQTNNPPASTASHCPAATMWPDLQLETVHCFSPEVYLCNSPLGTQSVINDKGRVVYFPIQCEWRCHTVSNLILQPVAKSPWAQVGFLSPEKVTGHFSTWEQWLVGFKRTALILWGICVFAFLFPAVL